MEDLVKITVYLTDLTDFALLNEVMTEFFEAPYPARAVLGVSALPRGVAVEIEGIMILA